MNEDRIFWLAAAFDFFGLVIAYLSLFTRDILGVFFGLMSVGVGLALGVYVLYLDMTGVRNTVE